MVNYTPGGEFLVNTTVTGVQNNASIATLSNGGYVVTWQDASADSGDIRGRLYAADGTVISTTDFTINLPARTGVQSVPTVAALSGGGFVLAWQDNNTDGGDIRGRIFASDATPIVSSDFTFNNTTRTGVQSLPSVAGLVDGGFVVTWQGAPPNNDIWGRVFTSTGAAVGADDFVVNSTTNGVQVVPAVAALSDGGFVVAWQDNNTTSGDIRGRRFNANGTAVGSGDFAINTTTASAQTVPSIAALTNGGFVVAWQSGASNDDIYGQVFNASGAASGAEFLVNDAGAGTPTTGIQSVPSVAALADGGFLVTWQDQAANADIHGRVYSTASGTSGGSEFTLNATTSASQQAPSVAGLSDGSFIAVWQDNSGANNFDIRGQKFSPETTPPSITGVTIPNGPLRIGSVVTATITTAADTDTYTLVSGTVDGFALSNLTKVNNTTYTASFTVAEGGTDVAAGQNVPVANLVLKDSSNNSNTAFASSIVQNNDAIDANRPALSSATVNGVSLVLNYNEALNTASPPVISDFSVMAGGAADPVTALAVSGQTVTLTLGTAVTSGQTVTVTYTDPTAGDDAAAIQDVAGNDAVTLTSQAVTNNTPAPDTTPPSITGVAIPNAPVHIGSVVTATITTASDTDTYTLVSGTIDGFALSNLTKVNDTTYTADFTVAEGGTDIAAGQSVPVANLVLQDSANNTNTAFTGSIVQSNDAIDANRPAFASATVNGASLVLTYGEALDAANPPVTGDFAVTVGGIADAVTAVAINSQTATLTLAVAVTSGQAVSVTYTDPSAADDAAAIQDLVGNVAVMLSGQAVTNNTPAPPNPGGGGGTGSPVSTSPTPGPDNLTGTSGDDTSAALAGDDTVSGGDGNDLLLGNQDNDIIDGGAGNNTIYGGMGNDSVSAGAGNDLIFGNEGADTILANDGNNTIVGGQDSTDGADYITSGTGNDVIFGNGGNDSISAGAGSDSVIGGFGDDILYGNQGNDIVLGNEGNDLIFGGMGDDTLIGGLAADTLYGNEGNDVLSGNEGADRLVFGTNSGSDLVNGFSSAEGDRLDLQGQTYVLTQDAQGNAVLTLSGGGVVTLSGVASNQVNAGFFA